MMLGAHSCGRAASGFGTFTDRRNASPSCSISNLFCPSSFHLSIRLNLRAKCCRTPKSVIISCNSSHRRFDARSSTGDHHDDDYLQASLLVTETISHYRLRKQGFREEMRWKSSRQLFPYSVRASESKVDVNSIGFSFLRRFQSPTIFLKISCDGDFLLPIIVGEIAIEKLMNTMLADDNEDCPDQFQFVSNVVEKLGYEVKMVRITERVSNTYYAKLYFGEPGNNDSLSVDVRPSDAINVAKRCEAPIFVNRRIVLADAIRIGYGMGRVRSTKSVYDVTLDSAADGPDLLSEELNLVRNMSLAVQEERYNDAVMLRDKLVKLRESTHEH